MAAEPPFRPAEPAESTSNDLIIVEMEPVKKPRRSLLRALLSNSLRLFLWYTILTALFRCPTSLDELSPDSYKVCRPYIHARNHLTPHVQPYYDEYLASYVERARPHVNNVHETIVAPTWALSKQKYDTYASPIVNRVATQVSDEWARVGKPQLDLASAKLDAEYHRHLAPHITHIHAHVSPYLAMVEAYLKWTWSNGIVPAYRFSIPYLHSGATHVSRFVVTTLIPYAKRGYYVSLEFAARTVLPQLHSLYAQHVEPQLVRIQDHLVQSKDGKVSAVSKTIPEDACASSFDSSPVSMTESPSATSTSVPSFHSPASIPFEVTDAPSASFVPPASSTHTIPGPDHPPSLSPIPKAELAKKLIDDLERWRSDFNHATETGADDLRQQVEKILENQLREKIHGEGASHLELLREAKDRAIDDIQNSINHLVLTIPDDPTADDMEQAYDHVNDTIRSVGIPFKSKAMALRFWKTNFVKDTEAKLHAALSDTLQVIDGIRNIGLQALGMRWTYIDGVSYKDWARYHEAKVKTDTWRKDVEAVALKHKQLPSTIEAADRIEEGILTILEEFVSETARLKNVAKWKLHARDSSNDFSDREIPPLVFRAHQQKLGVVQGEGSKEGIEEADHSGSSKEVENFQPKSAEPFSQSSSSPLPLSDSSQSELQALVPEPPKQVQSLSDRPEL